MGAVLLLLVGLAVPATAGEPAVDAAAQRLQQSLTSLRPHQLGTDHEGQLWAWSPGSGRAVVFDLAGRPRQELAVPGVGTVDVDGEWGVVVLSARGDRVTTLGADGTPGPVLDLPQTATSVAWIGPDRVALGLEIAAHRVEIWSLHEGERIAALDPVEPVPQGPGVRASRATAVAPLPGSDHLALLDRFTGRLEIRDVEGRLLHAAEADDPRRAELDAYLARRDREARRQGEELLLPFRRFWLAVDRTGSAWTVENRKPGEAVSLLRLAPDGQTERITLATSCASAFFTLWRDHLVVCQHPAVTQEPCCSVKRIP